MKYLFFILASLTIISCSNAQTEFSKTALAEEVTATDGSRVSLNNILQKHAGKTVVIEAWASWCGDCVKAMPKMKALQKDNPDVDFVFISMDKSMEKWTAGIEKHELVGDHYWAADGMKGKFGSAIDLDWIPRYIVIDKTGKVAIYRAIETDFDKINKTLKAIK